MGVKVKEFKLQVNISCATACHGKRCGWWQRSTACESSICSTRPASSAVAQVQRCQQFPQAVAHWIPVYSKCTVPNRVPRWRGRWKAVSGEDHELTTALPLAVCDLATIFTRQTSPGFGTAPSDFRGIAISTE